jgi:hypothetical protein
MARVNRTLTPNAGAIRLSDFVTAATAGELLAPLWVNKLSIQMKHGGSGIGYVFLGIKNGATPTLPPIDGQLSLELEPATATAPGGQVSDSKFGSGVLSGTEDVTKCWIATANSGDSMIVTYDTVE